MRICDRRHENLLPEQVRIVARPFCCSPGPKQGVGCSPAPQARCGLCHLGMPAQSKDASQAPAHPKRVRKTEAAKMVKNLAPKARNGYALFMQSRYPEVQAGFQIEKGSPGRKQRDVIKAIGVEWQLLSQEEKKGWGDQAAKEKSAQQEAIERILPASSSKQKSDRVVDLVQPITKGGYCLDVRGSESQGAAVYWFPARHLKLGVKATAAMFKTQARFLARGPGNEGAGVRV